MASPDSEATFNFGEEGIWEVEKIMDVKKKKNGELKFRVRWQGFGPDDDTWEPRENLLTCEGIVSDFITARPDQWEVLATAFPAHVAIRQQTKAKKPRAQSKASTTASADTPPKKKRKYTRKPKVPTSAVDPLPEAVSVSQQTRKPSSDVPTDASKANAASESGNDDTGNDADDNFPSRKRYKPLIDSSDSDTVQPAGPVCGKKKMKKTPELPLPLAVAHSEQPDDKSLGLSKQKIPLSLVEGDDDAMSLGHLPKSSIFSDASPTLDVSPMSAVKPLTVAPDDGKGRSLFKAIQDRNARSSNYDGIMKSNSVKKQTAKVASPSVASASQQPSEKSHQTSTSTASSTVGTAKSPSLAANKKSGAKSLVRVPSAFERLASSRASHQDNTSTTKCSPVKTDAKSSFSPALSSSLVTTVASVCRSTTNTVLKVSTSQPVTASAPVHSGTSTPSISRVTSSDQVSAASAAMDEPPALQPTAAMDEPPSLQPTAAKSAGSAVSAAITPNPTHTVVSTCQSAPTPPQMSSAVHSPPMGPAVVPSVSSASASRDKCPSPPTTLASVPLDDGPLWKPSSLVANLANSTPSKPAVAAPSSLGEASAAGTTSVSAARHDQASRGQRTTGVSTATKFANTEAWVQRQTQQHVGKQGDGKFPSHYAMTSSALSGDGNASGVATGVQHPHAALPVQADQEDDGDFDLNLSDSSENSLDLPFGVNMDSRDDQPPPDSNPPASSNYTGASYAGNSFVPSTMPPLVPVVSSASGAANAYPSGAASVSLSSQSGRPPVSSLSKSVTAGNPSFVTANPAATAARPVLRPPLSAGARPVAAASYHAAARPAPPATYSASTAASVQAAPVATLSHTAPSPAGPGAATASQPAAQAPGEPMSFDFDDCSDDEALYDTPLVHEPEVRSTIVGKVPYNMLKEAVRLGQTLLIDQALRGGVDLELTEGMQGVTLLMIGAGAGQDRSVLTLLHGGARVNVSQKSGVTALMMAAEQGHSSTCEILIKAGAYLNVQQTNGETALMKAARKGCVAVVDFLLRAGANTVITSQLGLTAAEYAARQHHSSVHRAIVTHYTTVTQEIRSFVANMMSRSNLGYIKLPIVPLHCISPGESSEVQLPFNFQPQPNQPVSVRLFLVRQPTSPSSSAKPLAWLSASPSCTTDVYLNNQHVLPALLGGKPISMYQLWPLKGSNRLRLQIAGSLFSTSRHKQQDIVCACIYNTSMSP